MWVIMSQKKSWMMTSQYWYRYQISVNIVIVSDRFEKKIDIGSPSALINTTSRNPLRKHVNMSTCVQSVQSKRNKQQKTTQIQNKTKTQYSTNTRNTVYCSTRRNTPNVDPMTPSLSQTYKATLFRFTFFPEGTR